MEKCLLLKNRVKFSIKLVEVVVVVVVVLVSEKDRLSDDGDLERIIEVGVWLAKYNLVSESDLEEDKVRKKEEWGRKLEKKDVGKEKST